VLARWLFSHLTFSGDLRTDESRVRIDFSSTQILDFYSLSKRSRSLSNLGSILFDYRFTFVSQKAFGSILFNYHSIYVRFVKSTLYVHFVQKALYQFVRFVKALYSSLCLLSQLRPFIPFDYNYYSVTIIRFDYNYYSVRLRFSRFITTSRFGSF